MGSIGSELCRQIVTLALTQLHLIDHSEFALYTIRQELQARHPDLPIIAHLGSVCSAALVERILQDERIDTIYHAAAYKHVPLVETNIAEGLRNNVLGSQVIAAAAGKFKVETCVLISSDKAVRPSNIMGASKRIAELIFQAAASRFSADTTFCMVRFGNVLGSSGSVIPLFQRQIAHGGPLTITHPDVARYFMLISEAAQLVIQAWRHGQGRRRVRARHGRADQDRRPGAQHDRAVRPDREIAAQPRPATLKSSSSACSPVKSSTKNC
ncbi:polysaccharide biosynthesis protein [Massilia sp. B-10]|nr:polysaccharide biosynthesis protein [Massilia sp. B-10]